MTQSAPLSRPIVLGDRYTLVRQMATGGMAEIFLARQKSLAGFDKEIVIKLLKDRYRNDPRVVAMFMNEARIGAVLNHPNIVHVYDVGQHDHTPYIAMELIHGEELSQLCRRGLELGRFLPLEHAVDLVRQAAEGMGHFHSKRDEAGRSLSIVHRDISPSNMLVTRDGVLKLIDFGIARADWPNERRDPDDEKLVPGKYNYMSPEQVRGELVDERSDVFSLGIVLYEITVGKRLFKGRPEEVIQKITRGRIKPPTFVRRGFPAALEHVVMRALESHREDRYANAYELASDLEEYLREANQKSGPVRIARYLDDLSAAEGAERRAELVLAGEIWLDDDGEDALDFDRDFSPAPAAPAPAPRPTPAAPMAAAPLLEDVSGEIPLVSPSVLATPTGAAAAPAAPVTTNGKNGKNGKNGAHHLDDAPTTVSDDHEPTTVQADHHPDADLGEEDRPTDTAIPLPLHLRPGIKGQVVLPIPAPRPGALPLTGPVPLAPPPPGPVQGELDRTDPVEKLDTIDIDVDASDPGKTLEDPDPATEAAPAKRAPQPGRPIDLMLPETSAAFGAGIVDRRRGFPWLLLLAVLVVVGLILFLARG